jgi:predicted secreted protein
MAQYDVFLVSSKISKQVVDATNIERDGDLLIFYDDDDLRAGVKAIFQTSDIAGVKVVAPKKKGSIGGKARAKSLSPNRRGAIAVAAAKTRWGKESTKKK